MAAELNRRELLKVSSASLAGILLSRAAIVECAERSGLVLGFSLYGMRQIPILDALELCARIGYGAVELPVMVDWPADPLGLAPQDRLEIRKRLADANLQLAALMENLPLNVEPSVRQGQLERLKAAAGLAHDLSPDRPPLIETIIGGKNGEWPELRKQFVDDLRPWADLANETDTLICVKPHRFGALNTPEDAVWLMQQIDSPGLKLVYDYSHFQHRNMAIVDTVRQLAPHIRFVHVKDTVIQDGQPRFVLPGDGGIDYAKLFQSLVDSGYRGCVCVEVSSMLQIRPDYDPRLAARHSFENLAPALRER